MNTNRNKKVVLLICIAIVLCSCRYNFPKLNGYILLNRYYSGYDNSLYDLSNDVHIPLRLTSKKAPALGYMWKFTSDNEYLSCLTHERIDDIVHTIINLVSIEKNSIVKWFKVEDFNSEYYQLINNTGEFLLLDDDKKNIVYFNDSSSNVLYTTDNYINSFCLFKDLNTLVINESKIANSNVGVQLSRNGIIIKMDIGAGQKTKIDIGNGVCYSSRFNKVIYEDKNDYRIRYYDVKTEEIVITKCKPILPMNASYSFVSENIMVLHQRREIKQTVRELTPIYNPNVLAEYVLYDTKTHKKKSLPLKNDIFQTDEKIDYTPFDLSEIIPIE